MDHIDVFILNSFRHLNDPTRIEKYRKYEAEHASWLMSKYFSKKDIFGGELSIPVVTSLFTLLIR